MDPTILSAKCLRDRLLDVGRELGQRREGNPELNRMDAATCRDAAAMMKRLGTEVTRLRETIGCFEHGRLSRLDLVRIPLSWNNET